MRYCMVFLSLMILFCVALIWSIKSGSVAISVKDILRIVFLRDDTNRVAFNVIWKIRLPRILLSVLLGGALSLSGFLIQTFFRNPIAGPFVLGISSGAKMFLAVGSHSFEMIKDTGKVKDMSMLLVIGIMIGYICSAVTDLLINFAKESEIVNLTHWSLGTFSGASWQSVKVSACIILPVLLITFFMSKPMSAYALGEGYAQSLGMNVKGFRVLLVTVTGVLSACVAAFAGPISFVGIAVPHISRILLKTNKPIVMIPASFLCGSAFCVLCDLAARMLFSPTELSISTVTSAIGAPIVIWLMVSRRRKADA